MSKGQQEPSGAPEGGYELSVQRLSAGGVGNILEWYDFGLYGFMAPIISSLFFPSDNHIASLIGAYGVFAVGFAMRPLGGLILGHLGDRMGRKLVLVVSVAMMGLATTLIGCLPTYSSIGVWAPILLLVIRLLQGLSVGGEFSGSVTYLVETAPEKARGFAGSFGNVGSIIGTLAGSGAAALTLTVASNATVHDWAWRLPFLIGGILAIIGYFMRAQLKDEGHQPKDDDDDEKDDDTLPIVEAFTKSRRQAWLSILFTSGYGITFYLTLVFLPTFASSQGSISDSRALQINSLGLFVALLVVPFAGWLSDHFVRRRKLLIGAFIASAIISWFMFWLILHHGIGGMLLAQLIFALPQGMVLGIAPAMLTELFKGEHRLSGYSTAYNIGLGIAGGTAPLVATGLIGLTHDPMMPAWYLVLAAIASIIAAYYMKDRSREALR